VVIYWVAWDKCLGEYEEVDGVFASLLGGFADLLEGRGFVHESWSCVDGCDSDFGAHNKVLVA
jgi:hypothetical protein